MDIALGRRSKTYFRKAAELSTLIEVGSECVVPDTQEDIRQILSSALSVKLKSKEIELNEAYIKGELSAAIMYYSENGIEMLNISMPVDARMPSNDIDSGCLIIADAKVVNYDTRMINPRKIGINATVSVMAHCFKSDELIWFDYAADIKNLYVKTENHKLTITDTVSEKEVTITEEFDLDYGETAQLLYAAVSYCNEGSETVGERLIQRCRADIEAVLLSDGRLIKETVSAPFSQLFDVGSESKGRGFITTLPTGEYFEYSSGKLTAELHAALQLVYFSEIELCYAADAYSCSYVTEIERSSINICSEIIDVSVKDGIQLSYEPQQKVDEIMMTRAYVSKLEASESAVSAVIKAEIVYTDSDGEVRCGKLCGTADLALENAVMYGSMICKVLSTRASKRETVIEFRADIILEAAGENESELQIINSIALGEELQETASSAYIVTADDELWEIAKKYRSSVAVIREIPAEDSTAKKLFVPVIK